MSKVTYRPSALRAGNRASASARTPEVVYWTSWFRPVPRSWTTTSSRPFVSPGAASGAEVTYATIRPFALIAGIMWTFAAVGWPVLTRSVRWVRRSRR